MGWLGYNQRVNRCAFPCRKCGVTCFPPHNNYLDMCWDCGMKDREAKRIQTFGLNEDEKNDPDRLVVCETGFCKASELGKPKKRVSWGTL